MSVFNRRQFLKLSSSLLASAAVWPGIGLDRPQRQVRFASESIIVIGAGMAGINAARLLNEQGFQVTVLEGRSRIGGRVWTDRSWQGAVLDLGASWIQGANGNPMAEIAQRLAIETRPTDFNAVAVYDAKGTVQDDTQQEKTHKQFNLLISMVKNKKKAMQDAGQDDISLGQVIKQVWATMSLTPEENLALASAINTTIEHEYAADVSDLSLFDWAEEEQLGGANLIFPGGYDQIIAALAKGLTIKLSQVVKKIDYSGAKVKITTDKDVFEADRVVVTLPLGVLKQGVVEFVPVLPNAKQTALSHLGMGVLNKTYLHFPKAFWPESADILGYYSATVGAWGEWVNMSKYSDQPILLGFNSGSYADQLEKLSDDAIQDSAMQALKAMFGTAIPTPERSLLTRHHSDPFSYGSYSHSRPGGSSADYNALGDPVGERLFFAGEATSWPYPATVHGAYFSGERVAKQLVALKK